MCTTAGFEVLTYFGEDHTLESQALTIELARPWLIFLVVLVFAVVGLVYALKFRGRVAKVGEIDDAYSDFNPEKLKKH